MCVRERRGREKREGEERERGMECVRERERGMECVREREREKGREGVCVCEREREGREREKEREREREKERERKWVVNNPFEDPRIQYTLSCAHMRSHSFGDSKLRTKLNLYVVKWRKTDIQIDSLKSVLIDK